MRSKECDEDALPLDLEHMMNGPEGFVPMVKVKDSNHGIPIPKDIIVSGNHFDNCPQAAR
jgi:hypothetical protein